MMITAQQEDSAKEETWEGVGCVCGGGGVGERVLNSNSINTICKIKYLLKMDQYLRYVRSN